MKLSLILILFMAFLASSCKDRIDKINSDSDVENFLRRQNTDFNDFKVGSKVTLFENPLQAHLADSLHVMAWQIVDFDNNGLMDLLVYGKRGWRNRRDFFAVIDSGDHFTFHYLNDELPGGSNVFPGIIFSDNQLILIRRYSCEFCEEHKNEIIKTDSLIFKYGDFIEPNFNVKNYKIEEIQYHAGGVIGRVAEFELKLMPDRSVLYNAIENNDRKGVFRSVADTSDYNSIFTLLNYIDFPNLKEHYDAGWYDPAYSILTIKYDDGKMKKITATGNEPRGLVILFKKFFELREKQKWEKY